ncbi:MAG: 2-C-methyl-D-erythritol 2,4-cyclodiphosphate synthase [Planctomycetota bacterium]
MNPLDLRIGLGFDLHRLEAGRPCRLGGIDLPHPTGPVGHSDGDAVLHALCDALAGAAGLDDIGTLFPDNDPAHKGRDSVHFLDATLEAVYEAGFAPVNVDIVIATEGPRIARTAPPCARLAELLGVDIHARQRQGQEPRRHGRPERRRWRGGPGRLPPLAPRQ